MRNLDISPSSSKRSTCSEGSGVSELAVEKGTRDCEMLAEHLERSPQIFGDLSPEALNYIQQLQSELNSAEEVRVHLFPPLFLFSFALLYKSARRWFKNG